MSRGMIPEDLFHIQWVSDARLSPEGRMLACTVTRPDQEADDYRRGGGEQAEDTPCTCHYSAQVPRQWRRFYL